MDDEVANAGKTDNVTFPWLAAYPAGVPARIETPPYGLLGEIAPDLAARRPAARAFTTIMPNGMAASLTFAEVDRYSDAFAAYLRETLRPEPGARVAIQIPNGLAYPVAAFGIFKAGCVLVNVNPLYTAHEMAHVLADAEPSAIVAIDMFADKLAAAMEQVPVPHVILTQAASLFPIASRRLIGFVQKYVKKQIPRPRFRHASLSKALALGAASIRAGANVKDYTRGLEPSAIACLQYTGGTTGVSKGAMLTHRNLIMNVAQFLSFSGDDMRESDHVLTALPLYHIFAFTVNFLGFFIRGAHNILIPSPRPLTNLRKAFEKETNHLHHRGEHLVQRPVERALVLRKSAKEPAVIACRRDGFAGGGGPALAEDHWNRGGRRLRPYRSLAGPDAAIPPDARSPARLACRFPRPK